jgi:hypothetical protein
MRRCHGLVGLLVGLGFALSVAPALGAEEDGPIDRGHCANPSA